MLLTQKFAFCIEAPSWTESDLILHVDGLLKLLMLDGILEKPSAFDPTASNSFTDSTR